MFMVFILIPEMMEKKNLSPMAFNCCSGDNLLKDQGRKKHTGWKAFWAQFEAVIWGLKGLRGSRTCFPMGKRVPSTQSIRTSSKRATPRLDSPPEKMTFKEAKRRTIIAGLRAMKAPAVPCHGFGNWT